MCVLTGRYTEWTGITKYSFYRRNTVSIDIWTDSGWDSKPLLCLNDKEFFVIECNGIIQIIEKNTGWVISDIYPQREGYIISDFLYVECENFTDYMVCYHGMKIGKIRAIAGCTDEEEKFCTINITVELPEELVAAICLLAVKEFRWDCKSIIE